MKSVADLGIVYEGGHYSCSIKNLTSLKGAPSQVDGDFYCSVNKLTSLEGAPVNVGASFWCIDNKLVSLEGIHLLIDEVRGIFNAEHNPIKSHVLGLLLIRGITKIRLDDQIVQDILNKHLGKGRTGVLMAQEELTEAGLEEFAQI